MKVICWTWNHVVESRGTKLLFFFYYCTKEWLLGNLVLQRIFVCFCGMLLPCWRVLLTNTVRWTLKSVPYSWLSHKQICVSTLMNCKHVDCNLLQMSKCMFVHSGDQPLTNGEKFVWNLSASIQNREIHFDVMYVNVLQAFQFMLVYSWNLLQ